MTRALIFSFALIVIATNCAIPTTQETSVKWVLNSVDEASFSSQATLELSGLPADNNWTLYFNHIIGLYDFETLPDGINLDRIAGDFFKLYPDTDLNMEEGKLAIPHKLNVLIQRKSDAPNGLYMTLKDGSPKTITDYKVEGIDREVLSSLDIPTAGSRFEENQSLSLLPNDALVPIIPRPNSYEIKDGQLTINNGLKIRSSNNINNEIKLAKVLFKDARINVSEVDEDANLNIKINPNGKAESYELIIDDKGIEITANDNAGVFYALQSLASIVSTDKLKEDSSALTLRHCKIQDEPRFAYRGVHLDVARNFHSKETVLQLLDLMSNYKLNKFHFHITDDEGWRVEIPGLPELIEVGSKRGHTSDGLENLVPHYGSGHDVKTSTGTGYYSVDDFIEILQFAHARHIEVIPEIDIPSHARAAIKSMAARYKKYMDQGNESEAKKYLLHDFDDQSEYSSAQNFSDNIVCVCQESTYDFVAKVIDEVVKIFEQADVPLTTIHSGGDELPYGPWQKSPVCEKFVATNSEVNHTDDLHAYFMKRFKVIMDKHNLKTAGWEEIVLTHSEASHHGIELNKEMIGKSYIPYVWNAVWGWGREDMAYKLANAGYEIVFCNSASLYMDMAYNKNPDETGLSWSGWTTTKSGFDVIPLDIFANAKYDKNGNPLKQEDIDNKVRLTKEGQKNFKGIQGQIWCETITSPEKLEYMVFPKMLAIAERAWSSAPAWSDGNATLQQEDWNTFANTLGQIELKRLDNKYEGINYRLPLPGAKLIDGQLHANVSFPGLEIRYTTDGSEPSIDAKLYTGPVEVNSQNIKLKSFATNGRASRTATLK